MGALLKQVSNHPDLTTFCYKPHTQLEYAKQASFGWN